MLVIALTTTLCANIFINGVAFLIPTLHAERGLDLAEAGLVSALPSFGMVVTLIAWGYLVDRFGERVVLTVGSALTAAANGAIFWGAGISSTNSSGRQVAFSRSWAARWNGVGAAATSELAGTG